MGRFTITFGARMRLQRCSRSMVWLRRKTRRLVSGQEMPDAFQSGLLGLVILDRVLHSKTSAAESLSMGKLCCVVQEP